MFELRDRRMPYAFAIVWMRPPGSVMGALTYVRAGSTLSELCCMSARFVVAAAVALSLVLRFCSMGDAEGDGEDE